LTKLIEVEKLPNSWFVMYGPPYEKDGYSEGETDEEKLDIVCKSFEVKYGRKPKEVYKRGNNMYVAITDKEKMREV